MPDLRAMLGDRYEALATAISATVSGWLGHDTPSSPHGWRCADKTRYPGPCGHDGDMTGEVLAVLDDLLPDLLARAWDEGFDAGERDAMDAAHTSGDSPCAPNPYRQEAENNE